MYYLLSFVILTLLMVAYLKWAEKFGIIDRPNERSSHTKPTIRGGGIIFPMAMLCWGVLFDHSAWLLIFSVLLIGIIGFLDDRYSLHQIPRLIVQSVSVLVALYFIGISEFGFIALFLGFILITGWLNTFNFMDGINGISVLYALSVMLGVYLFRVSIPDVHISLIYVVGIALVIFGFVNVRTKALAFAGDVGSLSLGLIVVYFVSSLIIQAGQWEFIIFLSVYGVDSVLTITHRLIKRENIFKAHRSHLYQYLANEMKINHLVVSFSYAFIQLMIIFGLFILEKEYWVIYSIGCLVLLSAIHIILKRYIVYSNIEKL